MIWSAGGDLWHIVNHKSYIINLLLPLAGWLREMSGGLKSRTGRRNSGSSGHFHITCGIGVTASTSVFQTESAGAAPAYRTIFMFPRCKKLHTTLRRWRLLVRIQPGTPLSHSPVADTERHPSCKRDHVGAAQCRGSGSHDCEAILHRRSQLPPGDPSSDLTSQTTLPP